MLEPQRHDRLAQLRAPAARARVGSRRFSSSLATCCVIVDPPSTTRRFGKVRLARARSIAIGSTPGCDQNRRSSAATVACDEHRRQGVGREPHAARAVGRQRLVQRLAVAIDDERGGSRGSSSRPAGSGPRRSQSGDAHERDQAG